MTHVDSEARVSTDAPSLIRISTGLPFVIGVVGHRLINEGAVSVVRDALRATIRRVRMLAPHTEFVLLTSLAQGADQIAAQLAVEEAVPLIVVLPDAPDRFASGMDANSTRGMRRLLQHAESILTPEQLQVLGDGWEVRTLTKHEVVAHFIVQQSQLLVALWDGQAAGGAGGTASAVQYALRGYASGLEDRFTAIDATGLSPVLQIATPRGDAPVHGAGLVRWHTPEAWSGSAEGDLERRLRQLDLFNAEMRGVAAPEDEQIQMELIGPGDPIPCAPSAMLAARECARADALALRFQRRSTWCLLALVGLLSTAAMALLLYNTYPPLPELPLQNRELAIVYGLALLSAAVLYTITESRGYFRKHQDCRAIAEAMRVQANWSVNGIREPASAHYLPSVQDELRWIRHGLSAWHLRFVMPELANSLPDARLLARTGSQWLERQRDYFQQARGRTQRRLDRQTLMLAILSPVAFTLTLAWAAVLIYVHQERAAFSIVSFLAGIAGLGTIIIRDLSHTTSLPLLLAQYQRMARLYGQAVQALAGCLQAGSETGARDVLKEVGREALREHGDWLEIHRQRKLKNPFFR